ncbi:hypothetical protein [Carboxylicivirga sp. M1479]|uniref:hypothetical protein n=1 Tax=Carboxylicivirga sp. M1479 TaxID=2594476 RepID=UPI0011784AA5|nr:hypothetical protein [Carboxylicivirga sp. M1479]TRX72517.1 hypothetical protein FNN09_00840 [Carboxylicivirga sp. M1479]
MKHLLSLLFTLSVAATAIGQGNNFLSSQGQDELLKYYQASESNTIKLLAPQTNKTIEAAYLNLYGLFLSYQANEQYLLAEIFHKRIVEFKEQHYNKDRFRLMHSTLLIQQTLLYWTDEEYGKGIQSFFKAHRLIKQESNLTFKAEQQKTKALMTIFMSQIPEQYQFWASLFGLEGNLSEGFKMLAEYQQKVKNQKALSIEASLINAYCQLKFSQANDEDVLKLMQASKDNASPLLSFVIASLAIKNQMGDVGLNYLKDIDEQAKHSFPLLAYLKGRLLLNKLDSSCIQHLQFFELNYKGNSFKADALMRQAWWFHINDQHEMRDSLMSRVKSQSKAPTANDKQAQKEVTTLQNEPITLLKARLLFDGGYFSLAKELLAEMDATNLNQYDQSTYFYRNGRVLQKLEQHQEAIKSFDQVILLTQDDKRYIGPYAALEAAKTSWFLKLKKQTIRYLDIANELNTGEYKSDVQKEINQLKLLLQDK